MADAVAPLYPTTPNLDPEDHPPTPRRPGSISLDSMPISHLPTMTKHLGHNKNNKPAPGPYNHPDHIMDFLAFPNEILLEIASYLWEYGEVCCILEDDEGRSLADLSIFSRVHPHLHSLLTPRLHQAVDRNSLLIWAAINNNLCAVKLALSLGADIHHKSIFGVELCTATSIIASNCCEFPHLHEIYDTLVFLLESGGKPTSGCMTYAVRADDLGLIKLLVEYGADIGGSFLDGSPLCEAVSLGRTHAMRLLLDLGASAEDASYWIPVMRRVNTETSVEVLMILLEGGAVASSMLGGTSAAEALSQYLSGRKVPTDLKVIQLLERHGVWMPENMRAEIRDRNTPESQ